MRKHHTLRHAHDAPCDCMQVMRLPLSGTKRIHRIEWICIYTKWFVSFLPFPRQLKETFEENTPRDVDTFPTITRSGFFWTFNRPTTLFVDKSSRAVYRELWNAHFCFCLLQSSEFRSTRTIRRSGNMCVNTWMRFAFIAFFHTHSHTYTQALRSVRTRIIHLWASRQYKQSDERVAMRPFPLWELTGR